jgi:hypothetical protein
MTKRTDIHRPSAINPLDYYFVACSYFPRSGDGLIDFSLMATERERLRDHMKKTGGKYAGHDHGGNCHVCGAWFIDHAIYYHRDTNSYLNIGFDCANKMDIGEARAFRDFRTARKGAFELKAGKRKAEATLLEAGHDRAWELFSTLAGDFNDDNADNWNALFEGLSPRHRARTEGDLYTLFDLVRKLIKYGNLSEKQTNFLGLLVDKIDNARKIQAKWDAETEKAKPAPEGRVEFAGKILKVSEYETDFGWVTKVTIKTDDGWRVYVSLPSSAYESKAGDRIALRATLTVSDDDPKFAFGKRPFLLEEKTS